MKTRRFGPSLRRVRRSWRKRWQNSWRAARPPVTIVLALAVLVLGTIGFRQYAPVHYTVLDSLYRAVTLFVFGGAVNPPIPVTLQVARIIAPVLTGSVAIGGILALSREQARVLGIRLLVGDHVVIAGLGASGSRLAFTLNDEDQQVVAIERDPANAHLAGCRERGIPVLVGDATDPAVLRKAGLGQAHYLVIVCGADDANVDAAAAAAAAVRTRRSVLTTFVHLDDLDLWRVMHEDAAVFTATRGLRLEFFNIAASGARLLLDQEPPFEAAPGPRPRRPHLLVIGLDGPGEQAILYVARLWLNSSPLASEQLRITFAGASAEADLARLRERYPSLETACRLDTRPGAIEAAKFQGGAAMIGENGRCDITRAYVFLDNEADALMAALALHVQPDTMRVSVAVAVADRASGIALVLTPEVGRFAAIRPFGVLSAALSPALLLRGNTELLAQAKHAEFLRHEQAAGHTQADNVSIAPWHQLPDSLKESNRRFADGIGRTLAAANCVLVPLPLRDPKTPHFEFTPDEVETLARGEHERWAHDQIADGWRATKAPTDPKDVTRKLHPLLIPWAELDEEAREKDRSPIRELPEMVELTGFRIQRLDSDG